MSFAELKEFLEGFLANHHATHLTVQEKIMADYSKLMSDIAALSVKVDTLLAKPGPAPAPDEQPQVDAADAAVEAILAKIPA